MDKKKLQKKRKKIPKKIAKSTYQTCVNIEIIHTNGIVGDYLTDTFTINTDTITIIDHIHGGYDQELGTFQSTKPKILKINGIKKMKITPFGIEEE